MEDSFKLLIVDDNSEFVSMLSQYASSKKIISSVEIASDGLEALEKIETFKPDVVILDLIMPQLDGIGVLERLSSVKDTDKPIFVILSAIGQDSHVKRAMSLGASYYIVKPFDVDLLITRLYELYCDRKSSKPGVKSSQMTAKISGELLDSNITRVLHMLGIPPNLSGYRFLKEAIKISVNDDNIFKSVTKLLYPAIAENCSSSPQKVERSIRNAIDRAWTYDTNSVREQLFGYLNCKPSNSQFISTIVEGIRAGKF